MKPINEEYIRIMLERALENKVRRLSPKERERVLDEEAIKLLNYDSREKIIDKVNGIPVKMPINEQKAVDSIAAAYIASEAHSPYNFRKGNFKL